MKKIPIGVLLLVSAAVYSQVGVNTPNPASSLDVMAKNPTGTTRNVDGLLVPRVDRQRAQSMTGIPVSTLIYVNSIGTGTASGTAINIDETGYYYFDGTVWTKLKTPAGGPSANVNIYNSDGTLTGNRTVTQGANSLTFNSTAVNGFSVDGNTFSIDAANNQIGMGTTVPAGKLDIVSDNIGNTSGNDMYFNGYGSSKSPGLFLGSAGGTLTAPTNLTNGDNIGGLYFNGRIGGGWQYSGTGMTSIYKGDGNSNLTDLRLSNSGVERAIIDERGNMGLGTSSPDTNALLDLTSTTKGLLPPRMTTAQRDAINPKPEGLTIYNITDHCLQYWNATTWKGNCNGTVTPPNGSVTSLNCGSASFSPSTITAGVFYSGTMTVPYTGGNGQSYSGGTQIFSTGITGLTATLQAGTLANGAGTLTYTLSGTPSGSGTANFAINFNGASSCTVQKTVDTAAPIPASVASLDCTGNSGYLSPSTATVGTYYTGTFSVSYIGGNGQSYPAGNVISSSSGLTYQRRAGTLNNGSGTIIYDVTGTPTSSGTYNFTASFNGAVSNCTKSLTINQPVASVSSLNCTGNSGQLSPSTATEGTYYTGTFSVSYTGGNGQSYPAGNVITSSSGLTYQRRAGTLNNGSGTIIYDVSGTPTSSGTYNFTASFNGAASSCTKSLTISSAPVVISTLIGKICAYASTGMIFGVVGNQPFPSVITSPDGTGTLTFNHYQTTGTGLCSYNGVAATGLVQYNISGNVFSFDGMVFSDGNGKNYRLNIFTGGGCTSTFCASMTEL